ncbi:MAG: hypothetical protein RIE73_18585 [Coleofasciculus sp. C1-SOL-03]
MFRISPKKTVAISFGKNLYTPQSPVRPCPLGRGLVQEGRRQEAGGRRAESLYRKILHLF